MSTVRYPTKDGIRKAVEYLHSLRHEEYCLERVAQVANLSPYHFIRVFKAEVGVTPYQYFTKIKLEAIKEKLADKNLSVSEAFAACGIQYNGYYASVFRKKTGLSPSQYRKGLWEH